MKQSFKTYKNQSKLDISDLIGMIRSFIVKLHVFVKYYDTSNHDNDNDNNNLQKQLVLEQLHEDVSGIDKFE